GDDEIIPTEQAVAWFGLEAVGRSAARFDMDRLESLNAHYIREASDARLLALIEPLLADRAQRPLSDAERNRVAAGLPGLKPRAKTLIELADNALFYVVAPALPLANAKAAKLLEGDAPAILASLAADLAAVAPWDAPTLEERLRTAAEHRGLGLGKLAQPLRAALTGSNASPGVFELMAVLGREEVLARIVAVAGGR
ncbi:MAG: glutamate--tRNA ligase, partial [Alphaproteobacteria bacterium]